MQLALQAIGFRTAHPEPQPAGEVQEEHIIQGVAVSREWLREQFPDDPIYNQVVFIVSLLQLNAEKAIAALQHQPEEIGEEAVTILCNGYAGEVGRVNRANMEEAFRALSEQCTIRRKP